MIDRAVAPRTRYYAYKPATATEPASWYDFTFDGTTGAEIRGDRIILHLVDGGRGDNDGVAGQITHRGAPAAESPIPPPATDRGNDWGCTIAKRPRPLSQAADWGLVLAFLAFVFVRARGARV